MYVLNVIPFSRSAPAGTLSYRSRTEAAPGTLVRVTLRRKAIHALVVECMSVAEAKATLKAASFTLSGSRPAAEGALPLSLVAAAEAIADYHAAPLGTTFASLFAPFVQEEFPLPPLEGFEVGAVYVPVPVEAPLIERAARYRSRVAPVLKDNGSVLFVVPTIAELSYWEDLFKDLNPIVLSGTLSAKLRLRALSAAVLPGRLVLATPAFSFIPLAHLALVIAERASAGSYRMAQRPYLDMRVALRELARARGIEFSFGDYPLPLEYRPDPAAALDTLPETPVRLIDVRRPAEAQATGSPWRAVSEPVLEELGKALATGGRALVLAVRKGYAPSVVCRDCGHTLTDERGAVLTFSTQGGARVLRTADGMSERPAETTCPSCGSWNLLPLGIGIERVVEELREQFPDARIIEASREVRTTTAARKLLADAAQPGTIVAGTESVLPWLSALGIPTFDLGVLASADSLLAVPFWRARERLVRLGLLLSQCSSRVLVSSRMPEDAAVRMLVAPASNSFFTEETMLRKALGYPPYGTLIAVQAEAPRSKLGALDAHVRTALGTIPYTVLPDRAVSSSILRRSFVVRLSTWPDPALVAQLRRLPPSVRVLIDPEAF